MINKKLEEADKELRRTGKPGLPDDKEVMKRLQTPSVPEIPSQAEIEKMLFGGK